MARYSLAFSKLIAKHNSMKNRIITLHKVRSALYVAHLKHSTGLRRGQLEEAVRSIYIKLHLLDEAPDRDTVFAYLGGKRNVPFDPPYKKRLSWLMACEIAFPGCSRYFFHPLPNLLAGPLRSTERWETCYNRWPEDWIEYHRSRGDIELVREAEQANKKARMRRNADRSFNKLEWVHTNIFRLDEEVRDLLMHNPNSSSEWVRRYAPPDQEKEALIKIGNLEALTGALALWLEANEIRDGYRAECAKGAVEALMPVLEQSPLLKKVKEPFSAGIEHLLYWVEFPRYSASSTARSAYPITWREMSRYFTFK